jgi:hypothetical protein
MIYSFLGELHEDYMREVLQRLREALLFIKLLKYKFSINVMDFLSYYIGVAGVSINMSRVRII